MLPGVAVVVLHPLLPIVSVTAASLAGAGSAAGAGTAAGVADAGASPAACAGAAGAGAVGIGDVVCSCCTCCWCWWSSFLCDTLQLKQLTLEREEAAELRSMATRDAAKEYAVKLVANEKKLKQVRRMR